MFIYFDSDLMSKESKVQEQKPKVIYVPKPNEDSKKQIHHCGVTHSAAMAYIGYLGERPAEDVVSSHVKNVFDEMRKNGYESPLICIVDGALWTDGWPPNDERASLYGHGHTETC